MKTINTLITLSLLTLSSYTFASCNKNVCEGVSNVVFKSIIADDSDVKVKFHPDTGSTLSCNLDFENSAPISQKSVNYRNMQSMLLTAVAANLPIILTFDKQLPSCQVVSVEVKVVE